MSRLETNRLYIKAATLADASFILALLNSPGWLEFIGDRNVHTLAEAETYLSTRLVGVNPTKGCGIYTIFTKENDTPIGMSSLVKRDSLEHVDIGYALLPEHEGKGYATEASEAVLDYAMNTLGYNTIVGICLKNHSASVRVLEKIGLIMEKEYMEGGEEMLLLSTSLNSSWRRDFLMTGLQ
jgi:[ribosomal protein S5]-alanine N-acetyltransferase